MTHAPTVSAFLEGGGDLGALVRELDWAATPLGEPASWPQGLRSTLSLCLDSAFPIAIYWGPERVLLYNDAWRPILGDKHPWGLGRPAKDVWPEIWEAIDPVFSKVVRDGVGVFNHDSLLAMHRRGYVEECYFDYTFNPIRDAEGGVAGIFNVVTETTYRVINERRGRVQRDFAARLGSAKTAAEVIDLAAAGLADAAHDVPFAALYRQQSAGAEPTLLHLVGSATAGAIRWPLQEAAAAGRALALQGFEAHLKTIPSRVWPEPIREGLVLPVGAPGRTAPDLLMVVGASPRRALDADYTAFFESLAGHMGSALANAEAFEAERRRAESLAALDRAKTAFFSNVSHEFRTPLTLMLGPVDEVLEQPQALPPASRELLTVVQRNGQRLLKLVNALLDFSRIEAGRAQARYEPVDLATYTAELASVFRSAIEKAGMRLVVQCEPTPEPAFVDRDMWEKVVLNLLSNAFKYTLDGEIRVRLRSQGQEVQLSVEDTGIGIPADELPKVFDRFHRVEGARGRTQEGSGIGLALVQELVRLHGGSVDVQSEHGRGSRFTVHLPLGHAHLARERIAAARSAAPPSPAAQAYLQEALSWLPEADARGRLPSAVSGADPAAPRARIVLADDNADMRHYVARLLSMHEVLAVADGEEALAAAVAQPPDLVLTDVMMPGLDGFGLLKALRENLATAAVPVILLSARAGEEARVEGVGAGADDYLVKPFSARELLARVEAQLTLRRVRDEALRRERLLRAEAETLHAVAEQLAGELDMQLLVQKVTDAATALTGARYGAFFYDALDEHGEVCARHAVAGAPREAFGALETLRDAPLFAPTFAGEAVVRNAAVGPEHGSPMGHLPVTSVLAVPVKARSGEVLGALFFGHPDPGIFTDHAERLAVGIAALAAIAMDNARLVRAAREAERRKDEFLATLAHELRNPLAPLRTGVAILQRLSPGLQGLDPVARMMERQLVHIVRLIDDLLDLSRISLGKITLQKEPVELARVLHNAVETSRPLLEARSHRLSISTPPKSVWLDADPTRLAQVFANLLNNAAKFTEAGGHIDVRVEPHGGEVEVSVTDNGIGIASAMLERVFEMFSQLEDSMQKTQPGLGIGLTLVRQLVELHGGHVHAESDGSGRGTTVRVVLPVIEGAQGAAATAGELRPSSPPLRVLVADDNVDAALALQSMLQLDGHEVRTVHDGVAAVREAAAFRPHVVLLDIGMPGMNGFEACQRIRAEQAPGSQVLIAALTGWAQDEHQARSMGAGFDHHLVKPVEPEQVLALLAQAARQQAPPRGA